MGHFRGTEFEVFKRPRPHRRWPGEPTIRVNEKGLYLSKESIRVLGLEPGSKERAGRRVTLLSDVKQSLLAIRKDSDGQFLCSTQSSICTHHFALALGMKHAAYRAELVDGLLIARFELASGAELEND